MNKQHAPAHTAERFEPRSETEPRLRGYRLVLVRLVCLILGVVSVGLFVASIPSEIAHLHQLCTGTAAACNGSGQLTPGDVRRLHELGRPHWSRASYPIFYRLRSRAFKTLGHRYPHQSHAGLCQPDRSAGPALLWSRHRSGVASAPVHRAGLAVSHHHRCLDPCESVSSPLLTADFTAASMMQPRPWQPLVRPCAMRWI